MKKDSINFTVNPDKGLTKEQLSLKADYYIRMNETLKDAQKREQPILLVVPDHVMNKGILFHTMGTGNQVERVGLIIQAIESEIKECPESFPILFTFLQNKYMGGNKLHTLMELFMGMSDNQKNNYKDEDEDEF